jgi:hypothetical protein
MRHVQGFHRWRSSLGRRPQIYRRERRRSFSLRKNLRVKSSK